MMLEQLIHNTESRLFSFARNLWREDPQVELHEKAEQLSEELRQSHDTLGRKRREEEAVRNRLTDREAAAALLASRIETYLHVNDRASAWKGALELDTVRRSLQQDRTELSRWEDASRRQQVKVAQLEEHLAGLLDKLYPN